MFHVEHLAPCSKLLKLHSDEMGIHLCPDQLDNFRRYVDHLRTWNESINLTSITDDREIVIKHFVDSLAGIIPGEIPGGSRVIDVGSGAGFPGIPMKIARPDLRMVLVEPVQKKVSFLYSLIGHLRLKDVQVYYGTFQQFVSVFRGDDLFSRVTTRALKSEVVLRDALKVLVDDGRAILYLGHSQVEPVDGWSIVQHHAYNLPDGIGRRVISILEKARG